LLLVMIALGKVPTLLGTVINITILTGMGQGKGRPQITQI